MRISWLIAAQLLTLTVLAPASADAQLGRALTPPIEVPAAAWTFDLSAQTSLPMGIAVEAQLTAPVGFFARASVGHTPSAYLDAVASALGDAGAYRPRIRPLIDDAIGNGAWAVRLSVGWTAFDGLELSLGYTALVGVSNLRSTSIEGALNEPVRWPEGMDRVPFTLALHAVHGRVGWRFLIDESVTVRLGLGWTHAFAAEARVDVPDELRRDGDDPVSEMEESFREGLQSYGFTPELSLAVGARF